MNITKNFQKIVFGFLVGISSVSYYSFAASSEVDMKFTSPSNVDGMQITSPNEQACANLYWFDNTTINNGPCKETKQFCGSYVRQGLQTFDNQDACIKTAKSMPSADLNGPKIDLNGPIINSNIPKPDCTNLFWFDKSSNENNSNNIEGNCKESRQFCGSYVRQGLQTFNTQEECLKALPNTNTNTKIKCEKLYTFNTNDLYNKSACKKQEKLCGSYMKPGLNTYKTKSACDKALKKAKAKIISKKQEPTSIEFIRYKNGIPFLPSFSGNKSLSGNNSYTSGDTFALKVIIKDQKGIPMDTNFTIYRNINGNDNIAFQGNTEKGVYMYNTTLITNYLCNQRAGEYKREFAFVPNIKQIVSPQVYNYSIFCEKKN